MGTISQIWLSGKESKSISQWLTFAGNGKLSDDSNTSEEFREFLRLVPSNLLRDFTETCLTEPFESSGLVLQDIINQLGSRLGFIVEHGRYRGKKDKIGFDGIWTSKDDYAMVVEVKSTDTYSISLDHIATYREELILEKRINPAKSSILIVVGRSDTGGLEAQIRGSKHAWDIRLISTQSLMNLLELKETLNDPRIITQINELLKPREYTRLDRLVELVLIASKDVQPAEDVLIETPQEVNRVNRKSKGPKFKPVNFREGCVSRVNEHLKVNFIKQSRVAYTNAESTIGLICSVSKIHDPGKNESFWFSLYPHQEEFLRDYSRSYFAYGCGSPSVIFLIPYADFIPWIEGFAATENEERMYYHVVILHRGDRFYMQQPKKKKTEQIEITKYQI